MAQDLAVTMDNRPGALADLGEALGNAGINIDGISGSAAGDQGTIHVLVADGAAAKQALADAGIAAGEPRDVVLVPFTDEVGELGGVARKIADAGTNLDTIYISTNRQLVFAGDDNEAVAAAVG